MEDRIKSVKEKTVDELIDGLREINKLIKSGLSEEMFAKSHKEIIDELNEREFIHYSVTNYEVDKDGKFNILPLKRILNDESGRVVGVIPFQELIGYFLSRLPIEDSLKTQEFTELKEKFETFKGEDVKDTQFQKTLYDFMDEYLLKLETRHNLIITDKFMTWIDFNTEIIEIYVRVKPEVNVNGNQ